MLLDSDGKADLIRRYAKYDTFIETGTGYGDLPFRLMDDFDRIFTIEAERDKYERSRGRLENHPHIKVVHGWSEDVLPDVLEVANEPSVIWLDAHEDVRGGISALRAELNLLAGEAHRHVILIDDARLCNGEKGWLTVGQIEEWAKGNGYHFTDDFDDDVIRLLP